MYFYIDQNVGVDQTKLSDNFYIDQNVAFDPNFVSNNFYIDQNVGIDQTTLSNNFYIDQNVMSQGLGTKETKYFMEYDTPLDSPFEGSATFYFHENIQQILDEEKTTFYFYGNIGDVIEEENATFYFYGFTIDQIVIPEDEDANYIYVNVPIPTEKSKNSFWIVDFNNGFANSPKTYSYSYADFNNQFPVEATNKSRFYTDFTNYTIIYGKAYGDPLYLPPAYNTGDPVPFYWFNYEGKPVPPQEYAGEGLTTVVKDF